MKFKSFELHKFKPMMHGGTDSIQVEFTASVICIIGQNGCGKSSMLRELTVFPPTSSDYEAGGKKKLVLEHAGTTFILESNFDGKKGLHSFIKDGEELNISGTSTTQICLCESHFDYSNLIEDIISGHKSITSMGPSERKGYLLNCYPTSLDFLLQHHKTVLSKIKALKTNLKMLKDRQCELTDSKMEEREFVKLQQLSGAISNFRVTIDGWIRSFKNDVQRLKSHPGYYPDLYSQSPTNDEQVQHICKTLINEACILRREFPSLVQDDVDYRAREIKTAIDQKSSNITDLKQTANDLTQEINDYESMADKNYDEEINKLVYEMDDINKEMATLIVDDLPIIDKDVIPKLNLAILQDLLTNIHSCGQGKIIPMIKLQEKLAEIGNHTYQREALQAAYASLKPKRDDLAKKINRHKNSGYNPKCNMVCQLKSNYESALDELTVEFSEYDKALLDNNNISEDLRLKIEKLRLEIAPTEQCLSSVHKLETFFSKYEWANIILKNNTLIEVLNRDPFRIYSMIGRMIANSNIYYRKQELIAKMKELKFRKEATIAAKSKTDEFVSKYLVEKRVALLKVTEKYSTLKDNIESLEIELARVGRWSDMKARVNKIKDEYHKRAQHWIIAGKIKLISENIRDLEELRRVVDEKQAEVNSTVRDQESIRLRLDEEIVPTITKAEADLLKYLELESALSPSSGISHKAMVRFTNAIIRSCNEYIRHVWSTDMEISDLKDNVELDFVLPMKFNKNSFIKDISLGSKGQKEIIDLSWTVASSSLMGLGSKYPLKVDEPDSGLTPGHRAKLLGLISLLVKRGDISQLFLVNHHSSLFSAFANSQVVCISPDGVALPAHYNENVIINGRKS